jgi:hypothetical protein
MKVIKNKKKLIINIVIVCIFLSPLDAVTSEETNKAEILDIEQTVFNRGFPIRCTTDGEWACAQSYMPTIGTITHVELYIRKFGTPSFNLVVELREDHPEGTLLDSITFTPSEVISSWQWLSIDFDDEIVDPETEYFIVLPPPGYQTTSFGYEWGYAFGNQYADGDFWFTRAGAGNWMDHCADVYEMTFRTYGTVGTPDDWDGDGWTNDDETNIYYTDPNDADTDDDGINDPQDVDPLVDLEVSFELKRIQSSQYSYSWREAEDYDDCSQTDGGDWDIIYNSKASDNYYVQQPGSQQDVDDWIEWDFTANQKGLYHIWIRSYRYDDACSNIDTLWDGSSFFTKTWDDQGPGFQACLNRKSPNYPEEWGWSHYGTVYIENTGTHTLRVQNEVEGSWDDGREGEPWEYICLDSILITDDPDGNPSKIEFPGVNDNTIGFSSIPQHDSGSEADFYVKVTIAGTTTTSPIWYNDNNVLPDEISWPVNIDVPDDTIEVPIVIEAWEDDGASDTLCDISNSATKQCYLTYNLNNGTWIGDDRIFDIDFIGRTCGEVDGSWDSDANLIFEIHQNDYDNDGITYWQEINPEGPWRGSISPIEINDRFAVVVGMGASCKLKQTANVGSIIPPYKGTYCRYDYGYDWTDCTIYVDLMCRELLYAEEENNTEEQRDSEDIGVMFRYQDDDNYYLLRWEDNAFYDKIHLWKFVGGTKYELISPVTVPIARNTWYTLKVDLSGNQITISYVENEFLSDTPEQFTQVISISDSSFSDGTMALFTWKNSKAFFDDILVENDDHDILLLENFDYGTKDRWSIVDNFVGSSNWEVTSVSVDQEDFYVQPDFVYRILKIVGHYDEDNIRYLSAARFRDADGDQINDVVSVAVKGSVEYLLSDWLESSSNNKDFNYVYCFNHGDSTLLNSFLVIDSDRDGGCYNLEDLNNKIWDFNVNNWLPEYGTGSSDNGRLSFIVEACLIGHFINQLAADGRIITASTTMDTSAAPMTGTDYPSFSFNLMKTMANGEMSLGEAFNAICDFVENDDYLPNIKQQDPKLDDYGDSDSIGSDHYLPNGNDGIYALKTGI